MSRAGELSVIGAHTTATLHNRKVDKERKVALQRWTARSNDAGASMVVRAGQGGRSLAIEVLLFTSELPIKTPRWTNRFGNATKQRLGVRASGTRTT